MFNLTKCPKCGSLCYMLIKDIFGNGKYGCVNCCVKKTTNKPKK